MQETTALMFSILFVPMGMGFLLYGKKQRRAVPLLVGVGFMVLPNVVPSISLLLMLSIVLLMIVYYFRY
jgi:hypothetical protein